MASVLGCLTETRSLNSPWSTHTDTQSPILVGIHGAPIFSAGQPFYWNQICGTSAEYQLPFLTLDRRIPLSSSFQSRMFVGCFQKVIDWKPSGTDHLSLGSVVVL